MIHMNIQFDSVAEAAAFFAPHYQAGGVPAQTSTVALAAATQAVKPKAEKTAAPAKSAESEKAAAPAPSAPAAAAPSPAPSQTAASTVDYPTLQKKVFELAGLVQGLGLEAGEHVLSIARDHGGATFKLVPSENYAAALDAVTAKIAALNAEKEVA